MKKMRKAVAVVVLVVAAMALSQTGAFAAPTQGAAMATSHSENPGLYGRFLEILGSIWGGSIWGGSIWGGSGSGGGNNGAIWTGDGRG